MAISLIGQEGLASGAQYTGFKNRIINGDMSIDQRYGGGSSTPTGSAYATVDRWITFCSQSSKYSAQRNAGAVTPPVGFPYYLGVTSLSAYSVVAGDNFALSQVIEGVNIRDLAWGTVNASPITVSFYVRSSLTGTFSGAISNGATINRSYPFSYTISSANTWEYKTITIPGDTTGTWTVDTSAGLRLWFNLGTGSTYNGTAGAWAAADYRAVTGSVSVVGTNAATFYLTGVQVEKGSTATAFDWRPFGTELVLCQRYYEYLPVTVASSADGGGKYRHNYYKVVKRATPTATLLSGNLLGADFSTTIGDLYSLRCPYATLPSGSSDGFFAIAAEL